MMEISLKNINLSYGRDTVLNKIDLNIKPGVIGVLGVNGAGKSSLFSIISTLSSPDDGTYTFNGIDCIENPFEIRKNLGFLPQEIGFLTDFTVNEYLKYIALLKGCSISDFKINIDKILNSLNLLKLKNNKINNLSGGMKQRVGIAQAIINNPKVIIFDEPLVGLDLNERLSFNALISELSKEAIILISTHITEDIENICEKIIVLDKGHIKYDGLTDTFLKKANGFIYEKEITRDELELLINNNTNIIRTRPLNDKIIVRYISEKEEKGKTIYPSLEDAFKCLLDGQIS